LDPNYVKQVLTDSHTFVKGPEYVEKFSKAFGEGLVTSTGEKHKGDRRLLGRFFVRSNIEKYLPMMSRHTHTLFDEMLHSLPEDQLIGKDISHVFHLITNHMIHNFAIGVDLTETEEGRNWIDWMSRTILKGNDIVGKSIILGLPMSRFLPDTRWLLTQVEKANTKCDGFVQDRIKLRQSDAKDSEPDDILKAMLDANLSKKEIREHFVTIMTAGHDTTSWLLSYTSYLLATNPEVQKKLKAEIKDVVGDARCVTSENLKDMKYLTMTIKEALRLYSVIPFITRLATKDVTLRGTKVKIPKGCTVLMSPSMLSRDGDQWEDPSEFRPERFENISDQDMKRGYIPFAYGTRRCIGMAFAQTEAAVVLTHLLQTYTLSPMEGYKPTPAFGISLMSENGMRVNLSRDK